jgi:hypothetical protein
MSYQCVRTYRLKPGSPGAVQWSAELHLVQTLRGQLGFLGYRFVRTADDRAVSESAWETDAQAAFADYLEAEWVRQHISAHLAGLPDSYLGPVTIDFWRQLPVVNP